MQTQNPALLTAVGPANTSSRRSSGGDTADGALDSPSNHANLQSFPKQSPQRSPGTGFLARQSFNVETPTPQSSMLDNASKAFRNRMYRIFRQYDEDNSGTIDANELRKVMSSMGFELNPHHLLELVSQVEVDEAGGMKFDEFSRVLSLWMDAAQYKIFDDTSSTSKLHMQSKQTMTHAIVPDVPWRWAWDTTYMVVTLYFWISVLAIHFVEPANRKSTWMKLLAVDIIGTIFLLVDVIMRFDLAYSDNGKFIDDRCAIVKRYLYSWFIIDLIAMLPLRTFTTSQTVAMWLNHARLLLLFRLPTLFQSSGIVSITSNFVKFHYGARPFINGFFFFVCFMMLLATFHHELVVAAFDKGSVPEWHKSFVTSMYTVMYIIAGVGLGDVSPVTNNQIWFTTVCCLCTMLMNALVIGGVVGLLSEADVEQSRRTRLVQTQAVLNFFDVPRALQEEILQFQNHILARDLAKSYQSIVEMLPREMHHNILVQTRAPLLRVIPFFKRIHIGTVVQLAESLQQCYCAPESYIALAGEANHDLVLLNYGFVDVLTSVGEYITTLKRGDYFGELGLMEREMLVKHQHSFKALTYCDMFLLSSASMDVMELRFPKFGAEIAKIRKECSVGPQRFTEMLKRMPRASSARGSISFAANKPSAIEIPPLETENTLEDIPEMEIAVPSASPAITPKTVDEDQVILQLEEAVEQQAEEVASLKEKIAELVRQCHGTSEIRRGPSIRSKSSR